ncbi:MAG: hypothetical protein PHG00_09445 [Methylococcales bacterium]|nr:hypothetical protein [Methylococcales bacterium]
MSKLAVTQKEPANSAAELLKTRIKEVKSLRLQVENNRAESVLINQRKTEFQSEIAALEKEKAELNGFLSKISDWITNTKISPAQVAGKKQRLFDLDRLIADFNGLISALEQKHSQENWPILRELQFDLRNSTRLALCSRAEIIAAKIAAEHEQELKELAALAPMFELNQGGDRLGSYENAALTVGQLLFNGVFGGTLREPKFLNTEESAEILQDVHAKLEI